MATPVELPKLGNTVEECIIAGWRKQKGEAVSAGEVLADIETDKTTFELSAPSAGTLLEVFFPQGALVPVFTNLCVIGNPGENIDAFRPKSAAAAPTKTAAEVPAKSNSASVQSVAPGAVAGSAPVSPRAQRFAKENNFDPSGVAGSGPGGRILESDVRRELNSGDARSGASADGGTPVSGIREKIARRMRESLSSTAQYTLHSSAAAGGLLRLRAKLKASPDTASITINDLVNFCAIKALLEMPELNAEFVGGRLRRHSAVNLGFACDTPRGLMVPVIRDAQKLALSELARRTKELATAAVAGKISADDLSGGTFTVSNLGNLGIESFTPLLNPPQVAILGVGAIGVNVVRRQGTIVFVDAIGLSLTCDHQVIDGAPGAGFLRVVGEKIEQVESLWNP